MRHSDNPVVFFDISIGNSWIVININEIGGYPSGRIKMELFADVVPKVRMLIHIL